MRKLICVLEIIRIIEVINIFILWMSSFLSTYVYVCVYRRISEIKKSFNIKDFLIIFIFSIGFTINNLYNPLIFKIIISFFLFIIFFKLIFKEKFVEVLFYVLFITLISIAIELVCSIVISLVANSVYNFNSQVINKFLFSIFYIYTIYFLFRLKFMILVTRKMKSLWRKEKDILYLIIASVVLINIFIIFYNSDYLDLKYYFTVSVFVILFVIFLNNYLKSVYNNDILKVKNAYLESSLLNYAQTVDEYRILKHNVINDMMLLSTYLNKQGKQIINQIVYNYNKDINWISSLKNIPSGIQGLIYTKIAYAKSKKINIYVENKVNINIKELNDKKYLDACEVIGIALDNAIESTLECKNKLVYINFYDSKKSFHVEIVNTFCNDIDLNKIGNKQYSTKKRKSGLGLKYIFNLNKDIFIKNYVTDDLFKIVIKIEKK